MLTTTAEERTMETVHLFVLDTMADWEAAFAVAGINNPEFQQQPGRFAVRTVGVTTEPVRSIGGVTIVPDMALTDLHPAESAMLILPGGTAWESGELPEAVDKARELLASGVPVAAVCGATAGLADAGLLDDRPHTSNALEYLTAFTGYAGQDRYVDEPAVTDGDLITASGTAPVDFARAIFERLGVYAPEVLDAWVALYKNGDASAFYALLAAAGADAAGAEASGVA